MNRAVFLIIAGILQQFPGHVEMYVIIIDCQYLLYYSVSYNPLRWIFCNGKETVNVVPLPKSLVNEIDPPMSSARFLLMARPRPVPWCVLVLTSSIWLNTVNSLSKSSSLMPMPVSLIEISIWLPAMASVMMILPDSVNFAALLTRFMTICRSMTGSVVIMTGKSGAETSTITCLFPTRPIHV